MVSTLPGRGEQWDSIWVSGPFVMSQYPELCLVLLLFFIILERITKAYIFFYEVTVELLIGQNVTYLMFV